MSEPGLSIPPAPRTQCGCGQVRSEADPLLVLYPYNAASLLPEVPEGFSGYVHTTDIEVHACASCFGLYAVPKKGRKRRG